MHILVLSVVIASYIVVVFQCLNIISLPFLNSKTLMGHPWPSFYMLTKHVYQPLVLSKHISSLHALLIYQLASGMVRALAVDVWLDGYPLYVFFS